MIERGVRRTALVAVGFAVATGVLLSMPGLAAARSAALPPAAVGPAHATIPTARWVAQEVYDASDGYVLLFGGSNATRVLSDSWTCSAGVWTRLNLSVHPAAAGKMVYDPAGGFVLMFGGQIGSTDLDATWVYSGGSWSHLNLTTHPSPRNQPMMTYDARDGYVLLFGGDSNHGFLSDTWKFFRGAWVQLHPTASPIGRRTGGLAYDAADREVVLFGGLSIYGDLADTWTYAAGRWTLLSPSTHPGVVVAPSMAYDPVSGAIVLFGGRDDSLLTLYDTTWLFHGGNWTQRNLTREPPARQGAAMAYDAADGYLLLFGGCTTPSAPLTVVDTWFTYSNGTWH